jgi:hypothetical protein
MPNQAQPVSRPWGRYLRVSVRGLIVVVLLIGASLGWIVRSAHTQRDAVAPLKRAGGLVRYEWGRTDNFLEFTQVTDAGLAHLKGLTKLNYLTASRTHVTVAGLNELKQALPNLTTFH